MQTKKFYILISMRRAATKRSKIPFCGVRNGIAIKKIFILAMPCKEQEIIYKIFYINIFIQLS